jgi:signal transduction histidine kinase
MRRLLSSTRGRLALLAATLLAVGIGIADAGFISTFAYTQQRNSDQVLQRQLSQIAGGLSSAGGRVVFDGGGIPDETNSGIAVDIAVVGDAGPVAQSPAEPLSAPILEELGAPVIRTRQPIWVDLTDSHGVRRRVFATPVQIGGARYALIASRAVGEQQDALSAVALLLILGSVLAVAMGAAVTYWIAGRILRPVYEISELARTLSERDLNRRVEVNVPDDEMGALVGTFNGMLGRLESSFRALTHFTSDASHELRAPLALVRTEVELALSSAKSGAEYRRVLLLIQSEILHLSLVTERLLTLARADSRTLVPEMKALDAADFVHETAARWLLAARRRRVELAIEAPDSGTLVADPTLTRRILDNLIDNALRHSPAGATITVQARLGEEGWSFKVSDEGPGVPPAEQERIFERFASLDRVRTPGDGSSGAGLGLALCSAVAAVQHGEIRLVPKTGPGAVFELRLPKWA